MSDHVSPEGRSFIMKAVGTRDTGPEVAVRRLLHSAGYRYRLYRRDLPGTPDLTFPRRHKVIFVHGCYWHGHGCEKGRLPKSKLAYWAPKIAANRARDERNIRKLRSEGWSTLTVWQCELKQREKLIRRVQCFLGPPPNS
ncbi:very short patch repair endonuclease [Methyloceanibacter sp.]|uniref:very short patch repair endonuclease n=1 Tax=Methyloceanibacter sp. TaxID=1965321 RepID=UPI003D6CFF21